MHILIMDDDKVTQILSWEEQMPASENRQPPGSLDLNDNWPLLQFPHEGLLQSRLRVLS